MTDKDLSLLTDEEIVDALAISAGSTATSVDETEEEEVRMYSSEILRRLIAARAENRRKDEHIANLERVAQDALDFLENWELSDFPSAAHDESTQGSLYMTIAGLQAVLLQSEKGEQ